MSAFYQENDAAFFFKRFGIILFVIGLMTSGLTVASFFGPNPLMALRQAKNYLKEEYGTSMNSNYSFRRSKDDSSSIFVDYRFGGERGTLKGSWSGSRYEFDEHNDSAEQGVPAKTDRAGG